MDEVLIINFVESRITLLNVPAETDVYNFIKSLDINEDNCIYFTSEHYMIDDKR